MTNAMQNMAIDSDEDIKHSRTGQLRQMVVVMSVGLLFLCPTLGDIGPPLEPKYVSLLTMIENTSDEHIGT